MRFRHAFAAAALMTLSSHAMAQSAAPAPAPAQSPQSAAPKNAAPQGPQDPEARARFEKFRAACGTDFQTHCANIERGTEQGRAAMLQCVETNKVKFSSDCQAAIAERNAQRPNAPAADKPKG